MATSGLPVLSNLSATPMPGLTRGWVSQCDGRGTLDIIWTCLITTFLCSWSVLVLNVPPEQRGRLGLFLRKARWMLFTLFFPEVLSEIASEQWRSARQSVEDFSRLKKQWERAVQTCQDSECLPRLERNLSRLCHSRWTMRHAFFADMGGFRLDCPDFKPFPINAHQLVYLVEKNHLEYPLVTEDTIWDKNKADGFARALTLAQVLWFFIQSCSRFVQHLAISSLELSTLAFIFCTMNTFFFWRHKPLDIETPIVLPCSTKVRDILMAAGDPSTTQYAQTPLDFISPPVSQRLSVLTPFWHGIETVVNWTEKPATFPAETFGDSKTIPPRGVTIADMAYALFFTSAYSGIHIAGWNIHFPSPTEQMLWRISSLTLMGALTVYLLGVAVGTLMAGTLAKLIFNNDEETTILGVASLLPRWAALWIHSPLVLAYSLARGYLIVEGFVSLRALPAAAYNSVNWANFLPHF